jgi:hypothetical protein
MSFQNDDDEIYQQYLQAERKATVDENDENDENDERIIKNIKESIGKEITKDKLYSLQKMKVDNQVQQEFRDRIFNGVVLLIIYLFVGKNLLESLPRHVPWGGGVIMMYFCIGLMLVVWMFSSKHVKDDVHLFINKYFKY